MYNEARKNEFIGTHVGAGARTESYWKSIFSTTEKKEELLQKDLCELPSEVLQELCDDSFGVHVLSTRSILSSIRSYANWCKKMGYKTSLFVEEIDVNNEKKIAKTMVGSPEHLQVVLNSFLTPENMETMDNVYRVFFWLAFSGVKDYRKFSALLTKDIDIEKRQFVIEGNIYPIYRPSFLAFKKICELNDFAYHHPNYSKIIRRERLAGNEAMRGVKDGKGNSANTMLSSIWKKKKDGGVAISYDRVFYSGVYFRMREDIMNGVEPDLNGLAYYIYSNSGHPVADKAKLNKTLNETKRSLRTDYEQWANAFPLD